MNLEVVNNCLISIEAALRCLKSEMNASKDDKPYVKLYDTKCPWFIHGMNCANGNTLLKCYEKPCEFNSNRDILKG